MIPLRDENPTRTTPFVLYGLIALNVVVFLYNGTLQERGGNPLSGYELVPYRILHGLPAGPHDNVPAWVTVFTSMFMHANWLHIIGNMLFLWIFGNNIEDVLGHLKFLIFYLVCGVGAAVFQTLLAPNARIPMVGASGAIAGVLGAYILLFPRARVITLIGFFFFVTLPASVMIGYWIAIQILNALVLQAAGMGASGGVAYAAHIGGFVAGAVITLLLGGKRLLRGRRPVVYQPREDWYER